MLEIEGYKIIRELSQGPISTAFLGRQLSLQRHVLIKRLNSQWSDEQDLLERFRREALICARLKHGNIVDIIDVSTTPENLFLIIEYIEGLDLEKLIKKGHPLPFEVILYITREILQGLAYAHGQGVIHRDIKPSNIMISKDGRVKISDFGLARVEDLPKITVQGEVVGTPAYMSPEQARVSALDQRSDLFSLGVTIYEMCDGESPFRGGNIVESIQRLVKHSPIPLQQRREDIPAWFSELVAGLLEKKPENRPASAQSILESNEFHHFRMRQRDFARFISEGDFQFRALPEDPVEETQAPTDGNQPAPPRITGYRIAALLVLAALLIVVYFWPTDKVPHEAAPSRIQAAADSSARTAPDSSRNDTAMALQHLPMNEKTADRDEPLAQKTRLPAMTHTPPPEQPASRTTSTAADTATGTTAAPPLPARLFITCVPWGEIYLDGKHYGATPLLTPLELPPGTYQLELRNPNFDTYRREVVLQPAAGETLTVHLRQQEGFLALQVSPWARVFINGRFYETTPLEKPIALAPGRYQVELIHEAYQTWRDSIEITPGQILRRDVKLIAKP